MGLTPDPARHGEPRRRGPNLLSSVLVSKFMLQASFENGGRNFLLTGHIMALAHAGGSGRFATVDPYGYVLVFGGSERPSAFLDTRSSARSALAIAMNPSGDRVVVGSTAALTTLHRLAADGSSAESTPLAAPGDAKVRAIAFEDEDHVLIGGDDGRLARWTVAGDARREDLLTAGAMINAVVPLGAGRVAVAQG